MRRGIWWACCLICGSASAQDGIAFQYSAPPECPSEKQFRELVQSRLLGDPRPGGTGQDEKSSSWVSVEVRLEPAQHRATLVLKEPKQLPVERVVHGDSCDELVSGLALITALAFGAAREPANATASAAVEASAATAAAHSAQLVPTRLGTLWVPHIIRREPRGRIYVRRRTSRGVSALV
jgi:hypothetical protein